MNANWTKDKREDDILKQAAEEFSGQPYDIEFYVKSDDGGRHIEAVIVGQGNSSKFRKLFPLNYNGWRTVVICIKTDGIIGNNSS